jgi:predicted dehydrogenase
MAREDWGIAVVGLGGIAFHHLEGYRRQGLTVVGGADVAEDRCRLAREQFGLPVTTTDPEELIARPEVRVVDVTVPHRLDLRLPLVEAAARHGKAIFVQKPLMPSLSEAKTLVEAAEAAGVPMMVNQNSVFSPQALLLSEHLGEIGSPYFFQIENRAWFDASPHPWFGKSERWVNSDMAIHHYALVRHWFGDAVSVSAHMAQDTTHAGVKGETLSSLLLRFGNGVGGLVTNNWSYRGPARHPHPDELILLQGHAGTLTAGSKEVTFAGNSGERQWEVRGTWFPDAFGNAMAHFVEALDAERPFLCEARDNLKTVAIAEAAYQSAAEQREVKLSEVLEEEGLLSDARR